MGSGAASTSPSGWWLVHGPEVLFLDEPSTGLDPQNRANLWDRVQGLRDAGTTVFLTTHDLDEAAACASTWRTARPPSPASRRPCCTCSCSSGASSGFGPIFELPSGPIERFRVTPASRLAILLGPFLFGMVSM